MTGGGGGRVSLLPVTPAEPGPRGGVLGPQCGSSLPAPRATSPGLWFSLSALSSLPVSVTYTSRLQSCPSRLCEPLGWEWLPRCLWLRVPLRSPCGCQLWPQLGGGGVLLPGQVPTTGLSMELLAWPHAVLASLSKSQETEEEARVPSRTQTPRSCAVTPPPPQAACLQPAAAPSPHSRGSGSTLRRECQRLYGHILNQQLSSVVLGLLCVHWAPQWGSGTSSRHARRAEAEARERHGRALCRFHTPRLQGLSGPAQAQARGRAAPRLCPWGWLAGAGFQMEWDRAGEGRAGEGQDELEAPWYPAGLSGHQDRCLTPALALCVSSLWATSNLGLHAMPVWPRDDPAAPGAVVAVSESLKTLGHTQLGSGL